MVKCGKKGGKNWWKSGKIDESGSNSGKTYGQFLIGLFTLAQSEIRNVPKNEHPKQAAKIQTTNKCFHFTKFQEIPKILFFLLAKKTWRHF